MEKSMNVINGALFLFAVGVCNISVRDTFLYAIIFILFMPETGMVFRMWRAILLRFVSNDDGKLEKADFKDGSTTWSASLLVRVPLALSIIAYMDQRPMDVHWVGECLTVALLLWGINRFAPPAKPTEA
jgi:hypothetical protein